MMRQANTHRSCGRRVVFDANVDAVLKEVCLEIAKRYAIIFLEIGTDKDHVHFLIQSVPTYSPTKIVKTITSITAREVFKRVPAVKRQLWGGEFWSKGYFISTVGRHGNEEVIRQDVKKQAVKRRIRNCIVKMSRWSCFEGSRFWGLIPRSLLRGAFIAFVAEPERNSGDVHARLEQMHGGRVAPMST